jgi:hypothetical protein
VDGIFLRRMIVSVLRNVVAAWILTLVTVGCQEQAVREVRVLQGPRVGFPELGGFFSLGRYGSGYTFVPGADPEEFASKVMWYLRYEPEALDPPDDEYWSGKRRPTDPRERDELANELSKVKGVYFTLYQNATDAERDEEIKRLLETIDLKERGEIVYIEDFMTSGETVSDGVVSYHLPFDFDLEGDRFHVTFRLRADVSKQSFVELAVQHLRESPGVLRTLFGYTDDSFQDTPDPKEIRDRDLWAAAVAKIESLPFVLLREESHANRDARIGRLLEAVERKKNGQKGVAGASNDEPQERPLTE